MRRLLILLALFLGFSWLAAGAAYAETADLSDPLPEPNYLPWLIAGVVLLLLLVVVGAVAVGPERFGIAWNALPVWLRTWLNVSVGAALSAALPLAVNYLTTLDLPAWVSVVLLPFLTSLVRAVNPADGAYGRTGAVDAAAAAELDGAHEAGQE